MKLVFLIIDYVPHQILTIKTLIENYDVEIMAFHVGKFVTETPDNSQNFSTHRQDIFTKNEILEKIKLYKPNMIVTAGWMIPKFNWVCKQVKKDSHIPIVAMSDTPWYGTWKQRINAWIGPFHVKRAFTHLWVAGVRQYEYARRLGFCNDQIIFNSLCGDVETFSKVNIEKKKNSFTKNFVFIGRFDEIKGLRNLTKAWGNIRDRKGWTFTLIGQGIMKDELLSSGQFIIKDYMSQDELVNELQNSGCFVLPSLKEPWALVIHEAAIAGLPIVCTQTCGAASHFVIDRFNGFRVKDNSVEDLENKLKIIINTPISELMRMSTNSRDLSQSISPEVQIASVRQLVK